MGRPRKYPDDAARQQAFRDRKRAALEDSSLPTRDIATDVVTVPEGVAEKVAENSTITAAEAERARRAARPGLPTLEQYVQQSLLAAEEFHAQTSPQATLSTKTLADRLERAESYARWRYEQFLTGEVLSL